MAKKISQTLLEYAAHLLEQMPRDASFSQRQSVLQVVITVWNALVIARWGQEDLLPGIYQRLEMVRAMIDLLVERKRRLFANDLRAVGRCPESPEFLKLELRRAASRRQDGLGRALTSDARATGPAGEPGGARAARARLPCPTRGAAPPGPD